MSTASGSIPPKVEEDLNAYSAQSSPILSAAPHLDCPGLHLLLRLKSLKKDDEVDAYSDLPKHTSVPAAEYRSSIWKRGRHLFIEYEDFNRKFTPLLLSVNNDDVKVAAVRFDDTSREAFAISVFKDTLLNEAAEFDESQCKTLVDEWLYSLLTKVESEPGSIDDRGKIDLQTLEIQPSPERRW